MFLRHNILGIGWAVFILFLCGVPGSQFQNAHISNADKVIHAFLFAVLFLLLSIGFIKQRKFPVLRTNALTKVMIGSIAYGMLIEIMQGTIFIGRSIELYDVLANTVGVLIGFGIFLAIYGRESYV